MSDPLFISALNRLTATDISDLIFTHFRATDLQEDRQRLLRNNYQNPTISFDSFRMKGILFQFWQQGVKEIISVAFGLSCFIVIIVYKAPADLVARDVVSAFI